MNRQLNNILKTYKPEVVKKFNIICLNDTPKYVDKPGDFIYKTNDKGEVIMYMAVHEGFKTGYILRDWYE